MNCDYCGQVIMEGDRADNEEMDYHKYCEEKAK